MLKLWASFQIYTEQFSDKQMPTKSQNSELINISVNAEAYFKQMKNRKFTIKDANWILDVLKVTGVHYCKTTEQAHHISSFSHFYHVLSGTSNMASYTAIVMHVYI